MNQLLTLLKDSIPEELHKSRGLCGLANMLLHDKKITYEQHRHLSNYLEEHLPPRTHNTPKMENVLCWPKGKTEPRIKWCEEHMELTNVDS